MQIVAYWEDVCHEPAASAAWADAALSVANDLADLLIGRSWSLKGVAFAVGDDYANSELCFFKAASLLAASPADAAENWRRLAILRIKQGLLSEAREFLNRALRVVQVHGSPNQLGKVFLALGFLETQFGSHEVAAYFYGEAASRLDHSSRSFKIAAHNLMCAMIRSNDPKKLKEAIRGLQKTSGQFQGDSAVRFKWIIAVAAIQEGSYVPAKNNLKKVVRTIKSGVLAMNLPRLS